MYEQNNFTGGQDNNGNEKADTTEYRYVREEIPHRSYMDASYAASGEGYTTLTIATPTGEGLTSAKSFTRARRCVLKGDFRII